MTTMGSSSSLPPWAQELCKDIKENKPTLTKVTVVDMENNVVICLAKSLSVNTRVKDVDLDLSRVHQSGIEALEKMFATNTTIEKVRLETRLNDDTVLPCQKSCGTHEHYCSRVGIARGLARNSSVTKLFLDGHGFDNEFWFAMSAGEKNDGGLEELRVSRVELPPVFQDFVTTSSSLKRLCITRAVMYSGDNFDFFDSGVLSFALRAAPEQTYILLDNVRLQRGDKEDAAERFIQIGKLTNYTIFIEQGCTAADTASLAAKLTTNTTKKRLYLPLNPVGTAGVKALSAMLKINTTLQVLDLRTTFIDNQIAARALGQAIAENKSLVELKLSGNCAIDFSQQLAYALQFNTRLRKLLLSSTHVGDDGAVVLANALEANRTLQILDLTGCKVGHVGASALSQVVTENEVLEELHLADNPVEETGAQALLNALKNNKRLRRLVFDTSREEELKYWNGLTPCGRAMLTADLACTLIPKVLHRVSADGGANSLFSVLCERPDLVI
jgi:hypothetical protein